MATIVKTPSGTWKALIRKTGWPATAKTFRTKRDAEDWARRTEDEMVRGVYIQRAPSERMTIEDALKRYLSEVSPTKRPASADSDARHAKPLMQNLGKYSLAALTPELIAKYRDDRLAGLDRKDAKGKPAPKPRSPNTVRLDLALLGHLFNVAIKEWGIGLTYNPVQSIRRPAPSPGRDRRLTREEETRLMAAVDAHSNPMLGWIVHIALETGMRSSEITGLRRNQVDLDRRVVRLQETKNTMSRTVPLTVEATRLFREALNNPVRPIAKQEHPVCLGSSWEVSQARAATRRRCHRLGVHRSHRMDDCRSGSARQRAVPSCMLPTAPGNAVQFNPSQSGPSHAKSE